MIRHIVMFRVKLNGSDKATQIDKLKTELEVLPSLIREIKLFEIGINISKSIRAYDFILVSEFNDLNDLSVYQKHPEHLKVLLNIKPIIEESVVVDYEK